jgi:hypothetical protein
MSDEDELRRQHKSIGVGRGVRPEPPHGTYAKVVSKKYPCTDGPDGKLCDECRKARRLYRKRWLKTDKGREAMRRQARARYAKERETAPKIKQFWDEVKQMTESNRRTP